MIVVLKSDVHADQVSWIEEKLRARGLEIHSIAGEERKVLAVVGTKLPDPREVELFPGVAEVVRVSKPYKLASREAVPETSRVSLGPNGPVIGGPQVVVMAGPCSIEGREKFMEIAGIVSACGAGVLRGGAFKPRTSPYAFQGMGEEGLQILQDAGKKFGLATVTEVMSPSQLELVVKYADVLQIGARNMQNFELLKELGQQDKPVLLKRGLSATIEELLMSAEYILAGPGKAQVILCERGIRTYESSTRNTLDLSAIPVLRALTHLPVVADPSHGTGVRTYVSAMALAALAAGADGLMIECHQNPPEAFSDGAQSLYPEQLERLMKDLSAIAPVVGRQMEGMHRRTRTAKPTQKPKTDDLVGLQGVAGSFSEKAIHRYFGAETPTRSYETFEELFEGVDSGEVAYAMVPVENSLTGSIHVNYDLLLKHEQLTIVGEIKVRIQHNLVANAGVELADIEQVYSHPQAAAQCERFLGSHPDWQVVNMYDTAGSADYIVKNGYVRAAAISSLEAAQRLGLKVLAEGIESHARNFTRFLVVTRPERARGKGDIDKVSVVFETADSPGALYTALECFSRYRINLNKLESRPIPGKPWEYMFYLDVVMPDNPMHLAEALRSLVASVPYFRELGRYKAAP
jgi:3-deoxy-7-phosphoheptulonate synthase